MNRKPLATILVAATLISAAFTASLPTPTRAAGADHATGSVQLFLNTTLVPNAWSSLVRTDRGLAMTIHTSGLPAGSADTVWWVIFNHPQNCAYPMAGNRCGIGDIFFSPKVETSVDYAAGHVLGPDGTGIFGSSLAVGDTSGCVPANIPPHFPCNAGLTNPLGADVLLVIRNHGDPIPGLVSEQISSFAGGCSINACANVQASYLEATG
jgi:hypothetical protein